MDLLIYVTNSKIQNQSNQQKNIPCLALKCSFSPFTSALQEFCSNLAIQTWYYLSFEENNPYHWGVFKSPVAAGIGAGDHKFAIYPGHGGESIIPYRMNSVNPGVMMPELGRVSIHSEALKLIKDWINEMEPAVAVK